MDEENLLNLAMLIKYKNGEPMSTSDMKRYLSLTANQLPKMDAPDMATLAGLQTQYRSNLQNILAMGQQKQGG